MAHRASALLGNDVEFVRVAPIGQSFIRLAVVRPRVPCCPDEEERAPEEDQRAPEVHPGHFHRYRRPWPESKHLARKLGSYASSAYARPGSEKREAPEPCVSGGFTEERYSVGSSAQTGRTLSRSFVA